MFTNTKKQGNWGLGQAIAYFTAKGLSVSIPLTDSQTYDLIVDDGTSLKRVQVKSSTNKCSSGAYAVELRSRVVDSKKSGIVRRQVSLDADVVPKSISFGNGGKWDKFIAP